MATISTDTYLDGGVARTAGEAWTVNGCTLTIRTDTRVHANAPASMTGSLGTITTSSSIGGSVLVDGRNVRWMAFDTGSGNVPAIGTSITQGGVSGYLLGVWADYQSAPTAVGVAMPASGYIKFREVTGGTFSAGALSGISANATSADVPGWIEVCLDTGSAFTGTELGSGIQFRGSWFELGTTNGSAGQTMTVPTNGGGANTHVFGVQIETSPGSGVYEWYPTAGTTGVGGALWATTNMTTDARAKFVQSVGNGQIRIGSDGTSNIGYVPASGCKVRIPNIFGRTVATASRATNQLPGAVTRGSITGSNYYIDGLHCDFAISSSAAATKFTLKNFTCETVLTIKDNSDPIVLDSVCLGGFTSPAATELTLQRINGGTLNNVKIVNAGYVLGALRLDTVSGVDFTGLEVIQAKTRTATAVAIGTPVMSNCTFTNTKIKGANISLVAASNISFTNTDYVDRLEGNTTSNTSQAIFSYNGCSYITIDGVTVGEGGSISNTQPYGSLFTSASSPNSNVKIRNVGTRSAPLDCGSNASFYPSNLVFFVAGDRNFSLQRIFVANLRSALISGGVVNMVGFLFEDIYAAYSQSPTLLGRNAKWRKICNTPSASLTGSNIGLHWSDAFTSDTAGQIRWWAQPPSSETASLNTMSVTANQGTGYIPGTPSISLDTLNDAVYSECEWSFIGHTGFANSNAVISGANSTGIVVSYQLDTGSGYSGTWKQATGANLSAETVSPAGFKMKIRVQQTGSGNTSTAVTFVSFTTTTTLTAQTNNQYPLDTNTLSFTGLAPGSEVRCYTGTDPATAVEIGGIESTSGSTFSFSHSSGGTAGYIVILAMGYQPIRIDYTYQSADTSLLIQPVVDRNYVNP